MALHHRVLHHVNKHKDKIVAHINEHHKKYLFGAGVFSGRALTKFIAVLVLFFGMSKMGGGTIGADYYDAEWYASQSGGKINISSMVDVNLMESGFVVGLSGDNITGKTITGNMMVQ